MSPTELFKRTQENAHDSYNFSTDEANCFKLILLPLFQLEVQIQG